MGAGNASETARGQGVVEWLAEQGRSDLGMRLVAWAKVTDAEPQGRLLTREVGPDGLQRGSIRVEFDGRCQSEGFWAARQVRLVVHQAL